MLVLDEPFSGLAPAAVDTLVTVLRERAAAGVPVLFSSHRLDVVERLCGDLVVIAGGAGWEPVLSLLVLLATTATCLAGGARLY